MKNSKHIAFSILVCLSVAMSAQAEVKIPSKLSIAEAINHSIDLVKKSPYKDVHVSTQAGSFSGTFVKKTRDVLVLKNKTGSISMKTGKEKISYSFVELNKIVAISINVPE